MRNIRFRGYVKEKLISLQWVCNGYGVTKIEYTDNTSSVHLLTPYGDFEVEEDSVGQYTGLYDINGVEICEGDILRVYSDFYKCYIKVKVEFKYGCFMAINIDNKPNTCKECDLKYINNNAEICGNIFENQFKTI